MTDCGLRIADRGFRKAVLFVALLSFAAMACAAALPPAWSHWQYFRLVDPGADTARLAAVQLPVEVLLQAQPHQADLRMITAQGTEVPIVIQAEWEVDPLLVEVGVQRSKAPAGQSAWRADTSSGSAPISEIRFDTARSEFRRQLQVASSNDGGRWGVVALREIYRMAIDGQRGESLRAVFPETSARFWRVTVFNGNDLPLEDLSMKLYATPRRVAFRAQPGAGYLLLYGNPVAPPAEYELARLVSRRAISQARPAALGPPQTNASFSDPRPWSERHPMVLWSALAVAIAVLAGLSLRSLSARTDS